MSGRWHRINVLFAMQQLVDSVPCVPREIAIESANKAAKADSPRNDSGDPAERRAFGDFIGIPE